MKKVTLGLAVVASFACADIEAITSKISEKPTPFSNLSESTSLDAVSKVENPKKIPNNDELQNQVEELSNSNFMLKKENEELLQKLSEYQKETTEIPLELYSLLNQIPTEDKTTKDCVEFLRDLTDLDKRTDQIFNKSIEQDSGFVYQIEEIEKELVTKQKLIPEKLNIYEDYELKLLKRCNENKNKLPEQLEQLQNQITEELKKYPELANIKLEENLMNNNMIKTFRQNKSAEQAEKIKSLEKSLHEYYELKIKESDIHAFEKRTQNFSDNIAKIKLLAETLIKKHDRLEFLKNEALKSIKNAQTANDNQIKEKN